MRAKPCIGLNNNRILGEVLANKMKATSGCSWCPFYDGDSVVVVVSL